MAKRKKPQAICFCKYDKGFLYKASRPWHLIQRVKYRDISLPGCECYVKSTISKEGNWYKLKQMTKSQQERGRKKFWREKGFDV